MFIGERGQQIEAHLDISHIAAWSAIGPNEALVMIGGVWHRVHSGQDQLSEFFTRWREALDRPTAADARSVKVRGL